MEIKMEYINDEKLELEYLKSRFERLDCFNKKNSPKELTLLSKYQKEKDFLEKYIKLKQKLIINLIVRRKKLK